MAAKKKRAGAAKARKPGKSVKSNRSQEKGAKIHWPTLPTPAAPAYGRRRTLARLYAWLAEDLVQWQLENGEDDSETVTNCPVIVQIHAQAAWYAEDPDNRIEQATEAATALLSDNLREIQFPEAVGINPFQFEKQEFHQLARLMVVETAFRELAPYSPLGEKKKTKPGLFFW